MRRQLSLEQVEELVPPVVVESFDAVTNGANTASDIVIDLLVHKAINEPHLAHVRRPHLVRDPRFQGSRVNFRELIINIPCGHLEHILARRAYAQRLGHADDVINRDPAKLGISFEPDGSHRTRALSRAEPDGCVLPTDSETDRATFILFADVGLPNQVGVGPSNPMVRCNI